MYRALPLPILLCGCQAASAYDDTSSQATRQPAAASRAATRPNVMVIVADASAGHLLSIRNERSINVPGRSTCPTWENADAEDVLATTPLVPHCK